MKKRLTLFILVPVLALVLAAGGQAGPLPDAFPAFTAPSLDGETVSDAIFEEHELTVINFWGTFCPPCIREMPDLGKLAHSMPKGSRLVGIVLDVEPDDEDMKKDARIILERAGADFLQILPVEDMMPVIKHVDAVPTTIFVDAEGRMTGTPVIGARSEEGYRAEIEKALQEVRDRKGNL